MKRILVPTIWAVVFAFFSVPAVAASPGGGGGGGGGGTTPSFNAYCVNPQSSDGTGNVQPGDLDSCVFSVASGQLASGSSLEVLLGWPPDERVSCAGGIARGNACTFQFPSGARTGTQIGRQDFRVSASTPPLTRVSYAAVLCQTQCLQALIRTDGPGSLIRPAPAPPPPPSFPFATTVCAGDQTGGTAASGQLDHCTVSVSVGNSYHPGESVIVKPAYPAGTEVADCVGTTTGSYQTSGSVSTDGYCRLTVVSGAVPQFETLGLETIRLAGDAMPGEQLKQWVDFCNAPTATGDRTCLGVLGFIAVSGPGANVSPDPPVTASGVSFNATEGLAFTGTVAAFWDADPGGAFSEYAATIDWGDGTEATVGTTGGGDAPATFAVSGSHAYAEEGTYTLTISVSDIDTAFFNTTTATSTATVGDAPLVGSGRDENSLNPFNGVIATFTDANPDPSLDDFSASIDWGDGSTSAGNVSSDGDHFDVGGTHTYANLGPETVTIQACDVGGSCTTATSHLLIYGLSNGGNFVIADGNAAIGSAVTFWGAQWSAANSLTGGPAPDAFKGFGDNPAAPPSCGVGWSSMPGNSAGPPATVPVYMAVTVASSVTTDAPRVSGDSAHVVIVRVDPGYAPDPGHAGTGTVVATMC